MYDFIFKDATIVDGSLRDRYVSDIAIADGKILTISPKIDENARLIIDASRYVLTPGFIDVHTHPELYMIKNPYAEYRIGQGITTDVAGNCGIGLFPLNENKEYLMDLNNDVLGHFDEYSWTDFESYKRVIKNRMGVNQLYLVSHAPIRVYVLGREATRSATANEVERMCELLDTALTQGCYGLSSGLYYSPCSYADNYELRELLKVVKKHNKIFAVHHRIEGPGIVESIKEVLDLSLETGVKLELSHMKIIGREYGYLLDDIFNMIKEYQERGVDVGFDQYPFNYGSTSLFSLLPSDALALSREELMRSLKDEKMREHYKSEILNPEGWESLYKVVGPDDMYVLSLEHTDRYNNKSLSEIGKMLSTTPLDALLDILSEESGSAVMFDITESEETLKRILKHELTCFGTDSLYSTEEMHPRSYSGAIYLLENFVLKESVLTLEEAIHKMSGKSAIRFGLDKIGFIKEGYRADINLFDLTKLHANGKIGEAPKPNSGLEFVLVGGQLAYAKGDFQKSLSGILL